MHHIAGRHGERAVVGPDDQRPGRVDVERLATAYVASRQVDVDGAAERHAHVGVRPAQRLGVVEQALEAVQRAEDLAEEPGALDRLAGLERDRGGQRDRQLVERLVDVDARPRPPPSARWSVSIRSTRMPATLRPAPSSPPSTSTSLGHFSAMSGSRSASAAWTAYPVSSGSHDHDSARARRGAAAPRRSARTGPASPTPGRAGRGRRSGAR